MLSIPDGLHGDPARPAVERDGVWVIDYFATTPSLALPVVVTRPTFVVIQAGTKELVSSGTTLIAGAGSIVTMRSGTHVMSDLLPGVERYASTIISVDRDLLGQMLAGAANVQVAEQAAISEADPMVVALAAELRQRVAHTTSATEQQLLIKQVLVSILMDESIRTVIGGDLHDWSSSPTGRIRSIMSSHCLSPLRLDQYASMCAMSVSTFKRAFAETYHESPGKWLVETRLQRAADLLRTTERAVTDICLESGFGDLSNFTRSFTRRFDTPPSQFRRQELRDAGAK